MKLNYNKFLSNSKRSDVIGYNIYTRGLRAENNTSERLADVTDKWDAPEPGLSGAIAIGYQIDISDVLCPSFRINGNLLELKVVRNYWTPTYMVTYYRSMPHGEYKKSGLYCIKETKCFTADDTFVSEVTVFNDDRDIAELEVSLTSPFERSNDGTYKVNAKVMPGSLYADISLNGYGAAFFSEGHKLCVNLHGNESYTFRYGFAFSKNSAEESKTRLSSALKINNAHIEAEKRFNKWVDDNAPILETDDIDILKVYYYRLFLIKHSLHTPSQVLDDAVFNGECAYESPFGKWFGAPVGLPIPMQIEELKWLRCGGAENQIKAWLTGKGSTHGYIQFTPYAIWKYYELSGNDDIITEVYETCKAYTLEGVGEGGSLPITRGSWVTGAEYQPSFYQHTSPSWDFRHDSDFEDEGFEKARLHRLDEIVMLALNAKACASMAEKLGNHEDAVNFKRLTDDITGTVEKKFWCEDEKFFFDMDPDSGKLCDKAPSYDGIMSMLLEIDRERYVGIADRFADRSEFLCDFAFTSVAKSCPMYWFDNCITGPAVATKEEPHKYHCCWNGPVWPFAVSLALDGIAHTATFDANAAEVFLNGFSAYTELHFNAGDRSTPCVFEHYRPTDGMSFSPFADYFHSEWINLLLTHWAGIKVTGDSIEFEPLTDASFCLKNVVIKGISYTFSQYFEDGKPICKMNQNTL